MTLLLSLACYCYFFLTAAMLSLALVVTWPYSLLFDREKRLSHKLTSLWGYHFVWLNPFWNCRFEGTQHLRSGQSCVIVANHQSLADVFVLSGLNHPFKWVSKESLFRIPFFGWNMTLNDYVALRRGDIRSIKEMIGSCKRWLDRGTSIMMFPEGTRSETGELAGFRDGSFRLSLDCNVPLIPVVLTGTRDVISKHSRTFNFNSQMRIKVLPPVSPADFRGSPARMRDHVHSLMSETLRQMQQERAAGA